MQDEQYQINHGVVTYWTTAEAILPGGSMTVAVRVIAEPDAPDTRLYLREVVMLDRDILDTLSPSCHAALLAMAELILRGPTDLSLPSCWAA